MKRLEAKDIYKRIFETAKHPKTRTALENIKSGCDFIDGQKMPITRAGVAHYCKGRPGGPTHGTLHNNKEFQAYIEARRVEQKIPPDHKPTQVRSGNATADAYIFALEVDNQRLRRDLAEFKSGLQKFAPYSSDIMSKHGLLQPVIQPSDPASNAWQKERAQIKVLVGRLLNEKQIGRVGLELRAGAIVGALSNGRALYTADEVKKLQEFIGH